jgi:hypothetical protein
VMPGTGDGAHGVGKIDPGDGGGAVLIPAAGRGILPIANDGDGGARPGGVVLIPTGDGLHG